MAKLKVYTKEHLDAHIQIRKETREARQRIKAIPNKVTKSRKAKASEPESPVIEEPVIDEVAE